MATTRLSIFGTPGRPQSFAAKEAYVNSDINASDSGVAVDVASCLECVVVASDSGVAVDTAYLEFVVSDSGTGVDTSEIATAISVTDTGAGVDAAAQSYDIVSSDSGSLSREYAEDFCHFATASLAALSLGGYLPTGSEGTDWPDEFQLWEADGYLGDPLIAEGLMSLTESYTHVTATVSPAAVSASVNTCYLEDYYYRIHVVPSYIDLGQLLSAETREITVWNAYFTPQIMTSVTEVSTDGIEISEPVTIPYEFAPLEEVTYDADVGTSGPSTIGATVYFNFAALFPDSTLYCMIVGSRVMVWVWLPREAYTEEMCWRTDVLQTRNGEQRIAYLDAPRQTYKYEFSLPADQYSNLKVAVDKQAHGVWGLPIWKEHSTVSATAGADAINFDTSYADYQEGGWAILWESPEKSEAVSITTVRVDGIDIYPVLGDTFTDAWIMPMQRAILPEGVEFRRTPGQEAGASASFLCNDTVDLSTTSTYTQYRSYDVMTDGHRAVEDLSERIIRPVEQIDNGQGIITIRPTQDYTQFARTLGLWTGTKADLWALRQWLHARRGRQKPFWLPSYNQDMELAATITALTTDIEVLNGRTLATHGTFPCDFMLLLTNGTVFYRRVLTCTALLSGNATLSIDSALGQQVTARQVELFCFMDLVRLNADEITLQHHNPYRVDSYVPLMRVPE